MLRQKSIVLFSALLLVLASALPSQTYDAATFRKDFNQGLELGEEKICDKAVQKGPGMAIRYYEELWFEHRAGIAGAAGKCDALMASWERCFKDATTMEKIQRWADGADKQMQDRLAEVRANSSKLWSDYQTISQDPTRAAVMQCFEGYQTLAKAAESMAHYQEASELWILASVVGNKLPEKTLEDAEMVVFCVEQYVAARDNWGFTFDTDYTTNKQYVKDELARIEREKKDKDKRKEEGYDADAKGLDALLMPNAAAQKGELKFAALKDYKELDYGPKNGPLPFFWWMASMTEVGTAGQLYWFTTRPTYMLRLGANKFGLAFDPADKDNAIEIKPSSRPKPQTFYLAPDEQMPYAMFFWYGSDRERCGTAEGNFQPSTKYANVYYRSATSWKASIDKLSLTLYDDNCNGTPGDSDPFAAGFKYHMIGDAEGEGLPAPLFDSMEVGKGPRVPFSQFVKLPDGWYAMECEASKYVGIRPLNPEYVKTGKVKLAWEGPKPTAPDQLVIQGRGDYRTAIFDIAGGKEVEVPAGEYSVIFGRIVNGKGARIESATLWPTDDSKSFVVEADKTHTLEMGEPFTLQFRRDGDKNTTISALSLCVGEKSGCKITELHGMDLACTVLACEDDSGKGAKEVGEFRPLVALSDVDAVVAHYSNLGFLVCTWPVPKGYKEGALELALTLPDKGMKVGLAVKKHSFFKKLETVWK